MGRHRLLSDPPLSPPFARGRRQRNKGMCLREGKEEKEGRGCTESFNWSLALFITSTIAVGREAEAASVWKFGIIFDKKK